MSDNDRGSYEAFTALVRGRLDKGQKEYGGRSFDKEGTALLDEIREELQDVCGWGFILDERLKRIRKKLAELEGKS